MIPVLYIPATDLNAIPILAKAAALESSAPARWKEKGEWHVIWDGKHAIVRSKPNGSHLPPSQAKPIVR